MRIGMEGMGARDQREESTTGPYSSVISLGTSRTLLSPLRKHLMVTVFFSSPIAADEELLGREGREVRGHTSMANATARPCARAHAKGGLCPDRALALLLLQLALLVNLGRVLLLLG